MRVQIWKILEKSTNRKRNGLHCQISESPPNIFGGIRKPVTCAKAYLFFMTKVVSVRELRCETGRS
ncbi:hypothetical protein HYC85_029320 [Camellia sinensis]|uniref:Uncharacterized protein n=1 Tax=Camellia sinensis TaxID=4442 RepID=A0A7J7FXX0_CAMSI|nr:hypothetical protein HYC85_029320 [Camellia sinensis]